MAEVDNNQNVEINNNENNEVDEPKPEVYIIPQDPPMEEVPDQPKLTPEECFDQADPQKTGKVDKGQFLTLLRLLDRNPDTKVEKSDFYFAGLDINQLGFITKEQFIGLINEMNNEGKIGKAKLAFRGFDKNRDCALTWEEMNLSIQFLHNNITDENLKNSLKDFHLPENSKFPFAIWYHAMNPNEPFLYIKTFEYNVLLKSKCVKSGSRFDF